MAIADRFAGRQAGGSPARAMVSSTTTTEVAADTFGFTFRLPAWLAGGARVVWTILVAGMGLLAAWRVASHAFGRLRGRATDDRGEVERLKGAFRLDMTAWFKRASDEAPWDRPTESEPWTGGACRRGRGLRS